MLLFNATPDLPVASSMAQSVDNLYGFIFWVSVVCFIAIVGAMVYFVLKYRRKTENDPTPYIEGHAPTEIGISVGLFVLVMIMFYWGWIDFVKGRTPAKNAYEINVIGQQWSWSFQYANGRKYMNEIYVPKDTPVKLIMTSSDVLHSFFVPAFRLKRDVVPGQFQFLNFTAIEVGSFDIFCAEYCGTAHAAMLGKVHVLEKEDFRDWEDGIGKYAKPTNTAGLVSAANAATPAAANGGTSLVDLGKELYTSKTCSACHSTDGSARVGPSFKGLMGRAVEFTDGGKATVDENYLRESIMDPNRHVVKGFAPSMPTFKGQLTDEEVNALIAYIKSL